MPIALIRLGLTRQKLTRDMNIDWKFYGDLPANAKAYLRRISELVGQPVEMVSVGPERDQTIAVSKM